jgi:hypothetical protein
MGLMYLTNRYYDPETAQFISVDPLVGMTRQAYAYAADDPVNETDPNGDYFISGKAGAALACVVLTAASHGVVNCGHHEGRNWPDNPDGGSRGEVVAVERRPEFSRRDIRRFSPYTGRGWAHVPQSAPWRPVAEGGAAALAWGFVASNPELLLALAF